MLALALRHTNKLIRRTVAESGERLGRYFTPRAAASELALLLPHIEREEVRLLDAGAGTGILSAAAIEALCKQGTVRRILLDAYETDERMLAIRRRIEGAADAPTEEEVLFDKLARFDIPIT